MNKKLIFLGVIVAIGFLAVYHLSQAPIQPSGVEQAPVEEEDVSGQVLMFLEGLDTSSMHTADMSEVRSLGEQAVPALAEVIKGGGGKKRAAVFALSAIAQDADPKTRDLIVSHLKESFDDPDPTLRVDSAQLVLSLGDPDGIPILIDALDSEDERKPSEPPMPLSDYSYLVLKEYAGQDFGFDQESWWMWWSANQPGMECTRECMAKGFVSGGCKPACSLGEVDMGAVNCTQGLVCCCQLRAVEVTTTTQPLNASNATRSSTTTSRPGAQTTSTRPPAGALPPSGGAGATSCSRDECEITITLKIAFAGEATNDMMNKWEAEIENVWNGPSGSQSYGECKCPVHFEVITDKVKDCNPPPNGFHCVHVTSQLPRDTAGNKYVAYMYGVSANGNGVNGWWSTQTSRPIQGSDPPANYLDAAHEAGHMMGLGDDYDKSTNTYGKNIMGTTSGPDAKPTQEQIDNVVENNCKGEDAECPEKCCCPNGVVDAAKGEECDPKAEPQGCGEDEACTPDCRCQKITPRCGDGVVSSKEECDPKAEPQGCEEGQVCTDECKCVPEPKPQPPETVEPEPACGDGICDYDEACYSCYVDCACAEGYSCVLNYPGADERGCARGYCGNGECELWEDCGDCGDCSCDSGWECIPGHAMADSHGCVYAGPVCGDGLCDQEELCTCLDCECGDGYICLPGAPGGDVHGCVQEAFDIDQDGVPDEEDNCPEIPNQQQSDLDHDGVGDYCDPLPVDCVEYCASLGYAFPPEEGYLQEDCVPPTLPGGECEYACAYSYWKRWDWPTSSFSCCCRHIAMYVCPDCVCPNDVEIEDVCSAFAP